MTEDITECEECGGIAGLVDREIEEMGIGKVIRYMHYRCIECGNSTIERERIV